MTTTTTEDRSDTDLLLAYGRGGEEAAFEALARRHVDMIFAVSLRRSGNRQLAEEATQNVLIALSGKARKLTAPGNNLTAWLHTCTKFEVAKLRRREARIKMREQTYANDEMKTSTEAEGETFQRLLPVLDEAIDHLRAPDREVIVRRYLEGQDFRGIGEALGISEDAAQKRTSRAFDALNQFFKRKAGVTVSATGLAAGIGRHCAEAAPAACLHIAGKAASTGLASILTTTTITTMSIGKITAVAAGVVVIGAGVALLSNKDKVPPESVSSSPPEASPAGASSAQQPTGRPVSVGTANTGGAAENESNYSPNEELAKLEAMSPHPGMDEFARRLGVKHEQLLKDLTAELGLGAAQAASLKEVLDGRLKSFRATLETGPQPGDSFEDSQKNEMQMVTKAGAIIRGDGLRGEIEGILSKEQLAAFDEREAKGWQTQVESLAYRELAKLTPVLDMTEEQKDRAFEVLQKSSEGNLRILGDARAFMSLMGGQSPTQLDMTEPGEAEFFSEVMDGPDALAPDSPEFKKRMTEFVGGQIDRKVAELAPVLDGSQQQRYRDHLFRKSMLPMFGIEQPTPGQK